MWLSFNDFDRHFSALDQLRHELERAVAPMSRFERTYDRTGLRDGVATDDGHRITLTIDLPGVDADDLAIDLDDKTVTISAKREVATPEGYSVHRTERPRFSFKRSYTLPVAVDGERSIAKLTDGVLTLTMEKLPQNRARRIAVNS